MEYRSLGKAGLSLSVLGFGCGPLGGLYERIDESTANATLAAAYAAGISYFDTAPFYGMGLSERRLGTGLRLQREGITISTKVGRLLRPATGKAAPHMFRDALPFEASYDYSYDGILRSVEDSLARIGTDHLDILYIHDVNRRWHGDAVDDRFAEVMAGGYLALDALRRSGAIKAIGVGVNDPEILQRFAVEGDFDLFMLAGRYTLLDQTGLDGLFQLCARRGIGIVAAGPFNSGILATGPKEGAKFFYTEASAEILQRTRAIDEICASHQVPLATAALQFPLRHPVVLSTATGMISPGEVAQNVAALSAPVPEGFWSDLAASGLLHPEVPR